MARRTTTRSTHTLPNGFGNWRQLDLFLPETWTSDPSRTSAPTTFEATHSAISSLASASGPMPYDRQDGPTIVQSGPAPAHANLSARQAKALGLLTSGTSGLAGIGSSSSRDPHRFLENRLRARTQILGSSLYRLTWKPWVTASGRSRFRLRASGAPQIRDRTYWLADATSGEQPGLRQGIASEAGPDRGCGPIGSAVNGHWTDAEWLHCVDGKKRAARPGTHPVAHGTAARVERLRGYGNAIVAPASVEFIKAYVGEVAA